MTALNYTITILFLATVFFQPLALACVDIWSQTIVHAVSVIIAILFLLKFWNKKNFQIHIPFWKPVALLVSLYFLSSVFSSNRYLSRLELSNVLNGIFFFYCAVNIRSWCPSAERFVRWWGYIVFPLGLLLFYQQFDTISLHQLLRAFRMPSSMVNPNILSGYLIFWAPYWFYQLITFFRSRDIPGTITAFCAVCITASALFVTMSFSAAGGLMIAGSILFYHDLKDFASRKLHCTLSPVRLLILFLLLGLLGSLFAGAEIAASIYNRLFWIRVTLRMILHNPLLGVGPGVFSEAFLFFKREVLLWNTVHAHNIFFQMAAEIGIAGMISFVWLISKILFPLHRRIPLQTKILLAGLLSFIIKNLFDYDLSIPANLFMFWLWCGLIVSSSTALPTLRIPISSRTLLAIFLVIISLLLPGIIEPFAISRDIARGTWHREKGNYDEAMLLYEKALARQHGNTEVLDAMSQLYYRQYVENSEPIYLELAIVYINKSMQYSKFSSPRTKFRDSLYIFHSIASRKSP